MDLPEIHTPEELDALTAGEQLLYSKDLAASALEMMELARDSVTVPAGAAGNEARAHYNTLVQACANVRFQLGLNNQP